MSIESRIRALESGPAGLAWWRHPPGWSALPGDVQLDITVKTLVDARGFAGRLEAEDPARFRGACRGPGGHPEVVARANAMQAELMGSYLAAHGGRP